MGRQRTSYEQCACHFLPGCAEPPGMIQASIPGRFETVTGHPVPCRAHVHRECAAQPMLVLTADSRDRARLLRPQWQTVRAQWLTQGGDEAQRTSYEPVRAFLHRGTAVQAHLHLPARLQGRLRAIIYSPFSQGLVDCMIKTGADDASCHCAAMPTAIPAPPPPPRPPCRCPARPSL